MRKSTAAWLLEPKTCPRCNKQFYRTDAPYHMSPSMWAKRYYCSASCRSRRVKTESERKKIAAAKLGVPRPDMRGPRPPEFGRKISAALVGRKFTLEHRRNISLAKTGPKHPRWRGGITRRSNAIRNKLTAWVRSVKERDNFTCQICRRTDSHGHDCHADHIKPIATHPELMYDIDNGRTPCAPCHRKTPTYGGRRFYFTQEAA